MNNVHIIFSPFMTLFILDQITIKELSHDVLIIIEKKVTINPMNNFNQEMAK